MVLNQQKAVRIPMTALRRFLRDVRGELSLNGHELTVCLIPDAQMARLNQTYRGKRGPTDVLSFPSGRDTETYLGDIAIAPRVARRNARQFGRTLSQELRILMLHGVLHLLGYDHETDNGRMQRRERALRRRLRLAP